jgi:hypothetical protein
MQKKMLSTLTNTVKWLDCKEAWVDQLTCLPPLLPPQALLHAPTTENLRYI